MLLGKRATEQILLVKNPITAYRQLQKQIMAKYRKKTVVSKKSVPRRRRPARRPRRKRPGKSRMMQLVVRKGKVGRGGGGRRGAKRRRRMKGTNTARMGRSSKLPPTQLNAIYARRFK